MLRRYRYKDTDTDTDVQLKTLTDTDIDIAEISVLCRNMADIWPKNYTDSNTDTGQQVKVSECCRQVVY